MIKIFVVNFVKIYGAFFIFLRVPQLYSTGFVYQDGEHVYDIAVIGSMLLISFVIMVIETKPWCKTSCADGTP